MAYARLNTRITAGLNPNFRGLGSYGKLSTSSSAGLNPNFRGLGQDDDSDTVESGTLFSFGPAPAQSTWDGITNWLGSSSVIPGVNNFNLALGVLSLVFAAGLGAHLERKR